MWVRRYKTELKSLQSFYDDIVSESLFDSHSFEVKGRKAYIDGQIAGHFVALSVSSNEKSVPYPNVDKIIFDEFMIEKGNIRYLPTEVHTFLNLFDTVNRNRWDCRALLIGNNMSVVNPYFEYFDIHIPAGTTFWCNESIAIEYTMNEAFANQRLETPFGRLIAGTEYGNFALENKPLNNNQNFIEPKSPTAKFKYNFQYENKYFGVWFDLRNGKIYISDKYDSYGRTYTLTTNTHEPNKLYIKEMKRQNHIQKIKMAWGVGALYFENQQIKANFFELVYPLL